ncbi:unnamed protein product [Schistosoma margrebowiei]|uniref:Uncharacterized protein n=1 Tax=Schistosoma margrebowiei TaxID=48269 RepID=A0A183M8H7_9TREM|nr:unnamed protein product [Schistosoma margrebowiei]
MLEFAAGRASPNDFPGQPFESFEPFLSSKSELEFERQQFGGIITSTRYGVLLLFVSGALGRTFPLAPYHFVNEDTPN